MQVVRVLNVTKSGVRVTTEDGFEYAAGNAIVSVGVGVLQNALIDFVLDLPVSPSSKAYFTAEFVNFMFNFYIISRIARKVESSFEVV